MYICSYVNEHVFYEHTFAPKFSKISVALSGATCYYVVKKGARGATYRLGNEVTQ